MTAHTAAAQLDSRGTVSHLHHVGHVVRDIDAAIGLNRRMGFVVPPPSFPALASRPGESLRAFGAGNTHVTFRHSFVELVTVVDDHEGDVVGADATLVPLQAPAETLDRLIAGIKTDHDSHVRCVGAIRGSAHPAFRARRTLTPRGAPRSRGSRARPYQPHPAAGIRSGHQAGLDRLRRDRQRTHLSPEGRLALVEDWPEDSPLLMKDQRHPNGAVEIIESVLCVPDADLDDYERRYARYLQRPARRSGPLRAFELDDSSVVIVPQSGLDAHLPGEVPSDLPAFVGYGVAVANLSVTRDLLERAELPVRPVPSGGCFVLATAALGAAVIFRSDHEVEEPR